MTNKTTSALKLAGEALNAMLTHMGMDEDEWTKPTFNQAREAKAELEKQEPVTYIGSLNEFTAFNLVADGHELTDPLYAAPVSAEPCKECDAKQAKIDSLMLEYCPDEITDEQMTEWSANQKPVSECRHCGWLCMPNDSHSKKWYPMQEPVKQLPVALDEVRRIAAEYAEPNSQVDSGNLYWALCEALKYTAPVSAEAIRAEALEEAAKVCRTAQAQGLQSIREAIEAAIRELK